jgi:hypothetical protein
MKITRRQTLTFYSDPAHAWMRVPLSKVREAEKYMGEYITTCSYQRNLHVYLEEDQDAGVYLRYLERIGQPFKINERHTDNQSRIRGYDRYDSYAYHHHNK